MADHCVAQERQEQEVNKQAVNKVRYVRLCLTRGWSTPVNVISVIAFQRLC